MTCIREVALAHTHQVTKLLSSRAWPGIPVFGGVSTIGIGRRMQGAVAFIRFTRSVAVAAQVLPSKGNGKSKHGRGAKTASSVAINTSAINTSIKQSAVSQCAL